MEDSGMIWKVKGGTLECGGRTLVMGILNVTPDSFSDGGMYLAPESAVARGLQMIAEGADILDVGGESSRPGAAPVSEEEELKRVVPVVARLAGGKGALVSVDTCKARVAREAVGAGASIINDISAMRFDPAMSGVAAETGAGVILMHMQGTPRDMQENPSYTDLFGEITAFLRGRMDAVRSAGVAEEAVVLDPGIGFGKTVEHNLEIIRGLGRFKPLGRPLLAGPSRKSFIGAVLDLPAGERLEGTAAAVAMAVANGADIVRVHDVKEMIRAARMADALAGRVQR